MKRIILTAAALSTLAFAGAAAAQPYRGADRGFDRAPVASQSRMLETRIDRAEDRGAISRREARALRQDVADVQRLEWRYARDGLSNGERRDLDRRYAQVSARIRIERTDRDRQPERYGSGYGFDGRR